MDLAGLRIALQGLTTRGRAFLAGGVTAAVAGVLLGERDLVRVGALGALVPLAAALWMARSGHRLRLHRELAATQIEVGQTAQVRLEVANLGARTSLVRLEEQVPYALGQRPRFLLRQLAAGARTSNLLGFYGHDADLGEL